MYLALNKRKLINIKRILDFISSLKPIDPNSKPYTYNEVFNILTKVMNYSWRKGNTRPPRFLRQGFAEDRIIFKELISKLKQAKFAIVYIDEWSF